MTKKQAIEILNAEVRRNVGTGADASDAEVAYADGARDVIEALDRAGAFVDEETAAEIDDTTRKILRDDGNGRGDTEWNRLALRLATACRKAGLVKP